MNWYNKQLKTASVTFSIEGAFSAAKPMHSLDVCFDLVNFVWYTLKVGDAIRLMSNDVEPDISETRHDDPFGKINIYMNPNITPEIIEYIIKEYNKHRFGSIKLKLLGTNKSSSRVVDGEPTDTARLIIEENNTTDIEQMPEMNLANGNAIALIKMLEQAGLKVGYDDLIGSINVDELDTVIRQLEQNELTMRSYTEEPTEEINEQGGGMYNQGRSYEQVRSYIDRLKEMINYINTHKLPNRTINYS